MESPTTQQIAKQIAYAIFEAIQENVASSLAEIVQREILHTTFKTIQLQISNGIIEIVSQNQNEFSRNTNLFLEPSIFQPEKIGESSVVEENQIIIFTENQNSDSESELSDLDAFFERYPDLVDPRDFDLFENQIEQSLENQNEQSPSQERYIPFDYPSEENYFPFEDQLFSGLLDAPPDRRGENQNNVFENNTLEETIENPLVPPEKRAKKVNFSVQDIKGLLAKNSGGFISELWGCGIGFLFPFSMAKSYNSFERRIRSSQVSEYKPFNVFEKKMRSLRGIQYRRNIGEEIRFRIEILLLQFSGNHENALLAINKTLNDYKGRVWFDDENHISFEYAKKLYCSNPNNPEYWWFIRKRKRRQLPLH